MPEPSTGAKYFAFISYSHHDKAWGNWLHRALESYRIPRHLVGVPARDGKVPPRLRPVFQDREEFGAAPSLGGVIEEALRESRCLVVICSPAAAASRWVDAEIATFRRLSPNGPILPFIVSGVPHASEGLGHSAEECLPALLRVNGEPLGADARGGRESRQEAKLKLIAGILGVDFDTLKRRHIQQRNRRLLITSITAALIAGCMAVLAVQAMLARAVARKNEIAARTAERLAEQRRTEAVAARDTAVSARLRAERESRRQEILRLAAEARTSFSTSTQRSLLLSAEAVAMGLTHSEHLPAAEQVLRDVIAGSGGYALARLGPEIWSLRFGRAESLLFGLSWKGTLGVWRLADPPEHVPTAVQDGWGEAVSMDVSDDGGWVAIGTLDGTLRWCGLHDGRLGRCRVLKAHRSAVYTLQFMTVGNLLVSGGEDGQVLVWRVGSDVPTVIGRHESAVWRARAASNGKWLATASDDATVRLWSLGKDPTPVILRHGAYVRQLVFSPGARWLATGDHEGLVRIWDLTGDLKSAEILRGHTGRITEVLATPDGRWIISTSVDGTARAWPLDTPAGASPPLILSGHNGAVNAAAITQDGKWLITGGEDSTVRVWDLTQANPSMNPVVLRGHEGAVRAVAHHESGWLASAGVDGIPRVWRMTQAGIVRSEWGEIVLPEAPERLAISPDGRTLAAYGRATNAYIARLGSGGVLSSVSVLTGRETWTRDVAFSRDGSMLATVDAHPTIRLWSLRSDPPQVISTCGVEDSESFGLVGIDPLDGTTVGVSHTGRLFRCPVARGFVSGALIGHHDDRPIGFGFIADGRMLVSVGERSAMVWKPRQHESQGALLPGITGWLDRDIIFSHTASRLILRPQLGQGLLIWDIGGSAPPLLASPQRELSASSATAVSLDNIGRRLIWGANDGTIHLTNLTGSVQTQSLVLRGHSRPVVSLAITRRGDVLASSDEEGSLRLWRLDTRHPELTAVTIESRAKLAGMVMTPDGRWLFTLSRAGVLRRWPVWPEDLLPVASRIPGRRLTAEERAAVGTGAAVSARPDQDR